jgi:SNF2 family DNA or RNA helicase
LSGLHDPESNRRPSKRRRVAPVPSLTLAARALLERISSIRAYSIELKDSHTALIDDFDARAAAKRAAAKAAAKVAPTVTPPSPAVAAFSKGDAIRLRGCGGGRRRGGGRVKPAGNSSSRFDSSANASIIAAAAVDTFVLGVPAGTIIGPAKPTLPTPNHMLAPTSVAPATTLPAMSLLVEQDAPEKLMVEQSVIWRAHMINRRNAELARERLPKQPEAQRGKTHRDYFMDEALWAANDFREERKWKVHMAKRLSKAVLQHHAQRALRAERAKRDENVRLIRLANSFARDVKKFWHQMHELADYRKSIVREAELAEEREHHLNYLLKQTEAYTSALASNLTQSSFPSVTPSKTRQLASAVAPTVTAFSEPLTGDRKRSRVQFEDGVERAKKDAIAAAADGDAPSDKDEHTMECDDEDDEATLAAAEAEEENDPEEVARLEHDADLTLEELLLRQGIDPNAYAQDAKQYAESLSDSASNGDSSLSVSHDDDGDADTIHRRGAVVDAIDINQGMRRNTDGPHTAEVGAGTLASAATLPTTAVTVPPLPVITDADRVAAKDDKCLDVAMSEYLRVGEPDDIAADDILSAKAHALGQKIARGNIDATADANGATIRGNSLTSNVAFGSGPSSAGVQPRISLPYRLLRGTLRDYQRVGMEWLATMYDQKLNGILADEMGLGKTIQTISVLAWLALERDIWGPHLVVVPTSVMINWEVEFKKWLPGFKVMTYYGSMKERRAKRQGWSKPNTFHVCITSYSLVVQDASALRRKKWVYLILDEAHNIKNFQSQRWQTLLSFPSKRRLLLTGTPLQNSVMELWSLMHFLMPDVFRSHAEFKDWFSKPLNTMVTGEAPNTSTESQTGVVANLHRVLRPFLLRRLKADVEKNLPGKTEHILPCPLSKRQRQLYEDFMSRSDIKETLSSGDFIGVMNVLMQLRKVCNHPDLFEGRPIVSPFSFGRIFYPVPKLIVHVLDKRPFESVDLFLMGLDLATEEANGWAGSASDAVSRRLSSTACIVEELANVRDHDFLPSCLAHEYNAESSSGAALDASVLAAAARRSTLRRHALMSEWQTRRRGMVGADVIAATTMTTSSLLGAVHALRSGRWDACTSIGMSAVRSYAELMPRTDSMSEKFISVVRPVVASAVEMRHVGDDVQHRIDMLLAKDLAVTAAPLRQMFRSYDVRSVVTLPDTRLIQWDCGKLQILDVLMRRLKREGHRVLVFTQMTRVLDVLESFLNLHAHRYLRLDGGTKAEERQKLVERFNTDTRVFCMILTTRAGGLGLNLTGADTVVFYDTDYNPSMDAQAQDRAHRIGQTKPVHIYRLVSAQTVEENILRRAQQKRTLEDLVISKAGFTTDGFRQKLDVMALVQPIPKRTAAELSLAANAGGQSGAVLANVTHSLKTISTPTDAGVSTAYDSKGSEGHRDDANVSTAPGSQGGHVIYPTVIASYGQVRGIRTLASSTTDCASRGHKSGFSPEPPDAGGTAVRKEDAMPCDDVDTTLLAAEDERDGFAAAQRKYEERAALAEFSEDGPQPSDVAVAAATHDPGDSGYMRVETALTPVQRYALMMVESTKDEILPAANSEAVAETVEDDDTPSALPSWHREFSLDQMLRRHEKDEQSSDDGRLSRPSVVAAVSRSNGVNKRGDGSDDCDAGNEYDVADCNEDDAEQLVYEMDVTEMGNMAYLKALTDTDADIKLYLPLRDGDPEELKKSTVVNGTAAAGLECAEDAAFFPHAYNRMSRTPYATRRQKEKAAANLARRLADENRMKARESLEAAEAARKTAVAASATEVALEKSKSVVKTTKCSSLGIGATVVKTVGSGAAASKRPRVDSSAKSRAVSGADSTCGPVLSVTTATESVVSGLFTRPVKKPKNSKLANPFHGKAGVAGSAKEEIGLNDQWTVAEEQRLLDMSSTHSMNMTLVADALSFDPHVSAGHRVARGQKRCIDRMKTLSRDVKNGPPTARAVAKDIDAMRRHSKALANAARLISTSPPTWVRSNGSSTVEPHASHTKVQNDVLSNPSGRFSTAPPTLRAVVGLVAAPEYHKPGWKPAECTPAALARRRRPFLRPRAVSERRSSGGQAQRQRPASIAATPSSAPVTAGPDVNAVFAPSAGGIVAPSWPSGPHRPAPAAAAMTAPTCLSPESGGLVGQRGISLPGYPVSSGPGQRSFGSQKMSIGHVGGVPVFRSAVPSKSPVATYSLKQTAAKIAEISPAFAATGVSTGNVAAGVSPVFSAAVAASATQFRGITPEVGVIPKERTVPCASNTSTAKAAVALAQTLALAQPPTGMLANAADPILPNGLCCQGSPTLSPSPPTTASLRTVTASSIGRHSPSRTATAPLAPTLEVPPMMKPVPIHVSAPAAVAPVLAATPEARISLSTGAAAMASVRAATTAPEANLTETKVVPSLIRGQLQPLPGDQALVLPGADGMSPQVRLVSPEQREKSRATGE